MSPHPLRHRVVSAAAAAAMAGVGLVGISATTGAGTASAAECKQESTQKKTLIVDYLFNKSVPASVGQGTEVTYTIAVSTTSIGNPYVQGVWDTPPTALKDVKPTVKVEAFTLVGGILGGGGAFGKLLQEKAVAPGEVHKDGSSWRINHTGWAIYSGQAYAAKYTYKLPSSIRPGAQLTSGGANVQATPSPPLGRVNMPNLTACTTVRAPNAGEAVLGSLDSAGLGSAEGQLSSTGSLNDVLPGIIGGVIGDMAG
ncbi:hypothetical protein [Gordonia caeni]|uniref:Uncharacterized protein n=1 Tax=Gordonia caeni TaxID=1007097 RepID=A0ABP7NPT0_9ACTN